MLRKSLVIVLAMITALAIGFLIFRQSPLRYMAEPVITQEEYDRIEPGMTYAECVDIIGAPGSAFGSSVAPNAQDNSTEWVSYVWRNSADSSAEISFQYGTVSRKIAHNLR